MKIFMVGLILIIVVYVGYNAPFWYHTKDIYIRIFSSHCAIYVDGKQIMSKLIRDNQGTEYCISMTRGSIFNWGDWLMYSGSYWQHPNVSHSKYGASIAKDCTNMTKKSDIVLVYQYDHRYVSCILYDSNRDIDYVLNEKASEALKQVKNNLSDYRY